MTYLFDPQMLLDIGKRAVGLPFDEMARAVTQELQRACPGHVEPPGEWFFSLAGGITGIMAVLHGSLSEYVAIFGTPIGTEGFSGRFRIEVHDIVLAGEVWNYAEDRPGVAEVTRPGEHMVLRRGKVKAARLAPGTWLLEYGRGPIPTSLPMALGDTLFSAMDGTVLLQTLRVYGRLVLKELLKGKI